MRLDIDQPDRPLADQPVTDPGADQHRVGGKGTVRSEFDGRPPRKAERQL
ncbi:hypothetical protein [Phenylobacterium sp.]|nr:hypothetical protein [Phenylobacterium sp.]